MGRFWLLLWLLLCFSEANSRMLMMGSSAKETAPAPSAAPASMIASHTKTANSKQTRIVKHWPPARNAPRERPRRDPGVILRGQSETPHTIWACVWSKARRMRRGVHGRGEADIAEKTVLRCVGSEAQGARCGVRGRNVLCSSPLLQILAAPKFQPGRPTTAASNCGHRAAAFSVSDSDLATRGFPPPPHPPLASTRRPHTVLLRVGFPARDPSRIPLARTTRKPSCGSRDGRAGDAVPGGPFAGGDRDGWFNAVVWDVVVDPSFQGIGLGKAVMERLVEDLVCKGVTNIGLYAEPRVIGFYRPLGFAADPDGIKAMVYSTKKNRRR
ncbi:uncharacterized protein A4U43_C05F9060 [Asparagus officinalis]|uniref:N-acetyltransferase domain-containing protein n=1 Tax=Asparagus officinalis TaxID=4686 RepID=A0A5P1EUP7_ASPOF|nr:uncharacterized protein A4U43_C05F9060 [Asparagus officinalis]